MKPSRMIILPSFTRILTPIVLSAAFLCTVCNEKTNPNIPPALPTQPPTVTPLPIIPPDPSADTLRAHAAQRGKLIGAAVNNSLVREADYAEVLAREYNLLTIENAMKWSLIQPECDRYDWADADELVNFAIAHEMKVRGHTLIWQQQMPDWLKYTN